MAPETIVAAVAQNTVWKIMKAAVGLSLIHIYHITLIGCPKLDEGDYCEKLTKILKENRIKSLTVVRMEVPCCGGIADAAIRALKNSGKMIPWRMVTLSAVSYTHLASAAANSGRWPTGGIHRRCEGKERESRSNQWATL